MPAAKDLSGMRFGRLRAIRPIDGSRTSRRAWLCACDCGNDHTVSTYVLLAGVTKSCGCYRAERLPMQTRTHGMTHTSEYQTYKNIMARCHNPKSPNYNAYGARGIHVCDYWREKFEHFAADMGRKPTAAHTIERIDNAKGYEPQNCRWATRKEQAANRRPPAPRQCSCPNCGHVFSHR